MIIAEPHYFCLVLEVAWDNTQDIHCSVIDIAQVVILMDNVDDCLSLAWLMMKILVERFMSGSWLTMHGKDSRRTVLFSTSCDCRMGSPVGHFQVTITVPEHLTHLIAKLFSRI